MRACVCGALTGRATKNEEDWRGLQRLLLVAAMPQRACARVRTRAHACAEDDGSGVCISAQTKRAEGEVAVLGERRRSSDGVLRTCMAWAVHPPVVSTRARMCTRASKRR